MKSYGKCLRPSRGSDKVAQPQWLGRTAFSMLGIAASIGAAGLPAAAQTPAGAALEPVSVKAVVRFNFDGTALAPADEARILADVGKMKDVTWQNIIATGHTDAIGSAAYNDRLSARRAETVKSYLVGKGLQPTLISTSGTGEAQPVADNDTAAGRAQNRRTEIEFQGVRASAK